MTDPFDLRPEDRADSPTGARPALTVLTPLLAAVSAAVLLALGHLLRLSDTRGTLPGSLIAAGWTLAAVAAVSTLVAVTALSGARRRRAGSAGPPAGWGGHD